MLLPALLQVGANAGMNEALGRRQHRVLQCHRSRGRAARAGVATRRCRTGANGWLVTEFGERPNVIVAGASAGSTLITAQPCEMAIRRRIPGSGPDQLDPKAGESTGETCAVPAPSSGSRYQCIKQRPVVFRTVMGETGERNNEAERDAGGESTAGDSIQSTCRFWRGGAREATRRREWQKRETAARCGIRRVQR